MAELSAVHKSLRAAPRVRPSGMDSIAISADAKARIEDHALAIFVDCANAGLPFSECIGAVWFSGIAFAVQAGKDEA